MFYPMARAKTWRAQPHNLLKVAKNDMFEASDIEVARGPSFGVRHRIEHHKSNILCICNTFISLKVAEIMLVEVASLDTEKLQNPV